MDIAGLIHSYGYLAVFAGTFLEGEAILVMAGFAAQRGDLALPTVVLVALLASFLGDQLYFHVGQRYGASLMKRFPSMQPSVARTTALLHRHHVPLILAVRFMYGLRIVGPMALGMSQVPRSRFFVLNLAGAVVWAIVIGAAGYALGHVLEQWLANFARYEPWVLGAILCLALCCHFLARRRRG
ncbi:DedA family protein [Cupriavidus sp. BIC8F]|uniref:DedA family protein n=1 Tax=Cupriavidus sp. BIC8F TaxID=3079014 RepID=UPI00291616CA|nr:DedA family protein [Cupriavidus sp. BIC8F]